MTVAGFRRWANPHWQGSYQGVLREGRRVVWACTHSHSRASGWSAYGLFGVRIRTATECAEEAKAKAAKALNEAIAP